MHRSALTRKRILVVLLETWDGLSQSRNRIRAAGFQGVTTILIQKPGAYLKVNPEIKLLGRLVEMLDAGESTPHLDAQLLFKVARRSGVTVGRLHDAQGQLVAAMLVLKTAQLMGDELANQTGYSITV